MKNQCYLIALLLLLSGGELFAQTEAHKSLQLSWGVGNLLRQDLSASDMIHQDVSPINFLAAYTREKKLIHQVHLKVGTYNPIVADTFTYFMPPDEYWPTYPHSFVLIDLNYSLGKTIMNTEQWKVSLGGRARNRLHPSNYYYADYGFFGYYLSFGLDAWAQVDYQLNETHRFNAQAALPLFSFTARSPSLMQDDEYIENIISHNGLRIFAENIKDGHLQSWGKSQIFDLNINYFYTLSEKWEIGSSYYLSMNFNQDPTRFTSIENVLYLSTNLTF